RGSGGVGDGDDRYQIALMAEELHRDTDWERLEPRLRAMTRMLVRRHKTRIDRVARALLAKTTVSAKALDKMGGRSVDDTRIMRRFCWRCTEGEQRAKCYSLTEWRCVPPVQRHIAKQHHQLPSSTGCVKLGRCAHVPFMVLLKQFPQCLVKAQGY